GSVRFFHGDVLSLQTDLRYDLVYSSNVFLHIHDKDALLERLRSLLNEGGRLVFGDYCQIGQSEEMAAYIAQWGYHILRTEEWLALLEAHGFRRTHSEDATGQLKKYSEEALRTEGIGDSWREILTRRVARIERGHHRWCVFCFERA